MTGAHERHPSQLPWREIEGTEISLAPPVELHRDSEALADIRVASGGATCCLRRMPNRAELLVWDGPPDGAPESWTGAPGLPIIGLFGFDGREALAWTQNAILRIRAGAVDVLYEAPHDVGVARLSHDRTHMAWIERAALHELCTMRLADGAVARWPSTEGWCAHAAWLDDGTLLVSEVRVRNDISEASLLTILDPTDGRREPVLETRDWLLNHVGPAAGPRAAFLSGHRAPFPVGRAEFRWWPSRPLPPRDGTWRIQLGPVRATIECLASVAIGSPGDGWHVDGGCLFSAARYQTARSAMLVVASAAGVHHGRTSDPIADFALDRPGKRILYRTFGDRHAIMALGIEELLP